MAWLEGFRSRFGKCGAAAEPTISECDAILARFEKVMGDAKTSLEIKNYCRKRKANGGALPYGLSHFLTQFRSAVSIHASCNCNYVLIT